MTWAASRIDRLAGGRFIEVSGAAVAGGFLGLHVRGDLADATFALVHPDPIRSVRAALEDARASRKPSAHQGLDRPGVFRDHPGSVPSAE